jgi:uncharacterized membrane protein
MEIGRENKLIYSLRGYMLEISIAIFVVIFAIVSIFLIRLIISLQHTLMHVNRALIDAEFKLQRMDSITRAISNVGDICERETERIKKKSLNRLEREYVEDEVVEREARVKSDNSGDIMDWIALSLKLSQKFLNKRR